MPAGPPFDLSRRNRLINFRPTAQTLNLTEVSVPLMLDVRDDPRGAVVHLALRSRRAPRRGKPQPLGKWIRYDEAPYAANSLDKLIATARRDRAEYGQDQLRLVPAFLRWHDLKNDRDTRLASPLVLAKVELAKKRGVRDSYTLRVTDPIAEVNPTLRHHLRQLYGINLPETVDLAEPGAIAALHERLAKEIQASSRGCSSSAGEAADRPCPAAGDGRLRNYRDGSMGTRRTSSAGGTTRTPTGGPTTSRSACRSSGSAGRAGVAAGVALGEPPRRRGGSRPIPYTIDTDGGPYSWDVDLCAVALANFNYRTLGLVRDYDELLDGTVVPVVRAAVLGSAAADQQRAAAGLPSRPTSLYLPTVRRWQRLRAHSVARAS